MDFLHLDSWPFKIALILAILAAREFVRFTSNMPSNASRAPQYGRGPMGRPAKKQETSEGAKWIIETLDSAAIAIGLVLFIIQPFLIQAFYIPSGSMEDTLRIDDRLLVSKMLYRLRDPNFQDVVVFKAPPRALATSTGLPEEGETDFIKRCIGTPGDVVYVVNRQVYRKGVNESTFKKINEPYVKWSPDSPLVSYDMKIVNGKVYSREYRSPSFPDPWTCESNGVGYEQQQAITNAAPEAIPAGSYLVFGDHRNNSNDSHAWGFVPRANIIGKAICVFWPPTRVGVIDNMSFHPRPPQRPTQSQPVVSSP